MCLKANFSSGIVAKHRVAGVVVGYIIPIGLAPAQVNIVAVVHALYPIAGESDALCAVVAKDAAIVFYTVNIVNVVVAYDDAVGASPRVYGAAVHKRVLRKVGEESFGVEQFVAGNNTATFAVGFGPSPDTCSDAAVTEVGNGVIFDNETIATHLYGKALLHTEGAVGKIVISDFCPDTSRFALNAVTHEGVDAVAGETDVGGFPVDEDGSSDPAERAAAERNGVGVA